QAEPRSLRTRREERDEDLAALVRGDPRAVVVDLDLDRGGGLPSGDPHAEPAPRLLSGVGGVLEEVAEDAAQEPLVPGDAPERSRERDVDPCRWMLEARAEEVFEIDARSLRLRRPRIEQELVDLRPHRVDLLQDLLRRTVDAGIVPFLEHARVAEDR